MSIKTTLRAVLLLGALATAPQALADDTMATLGAGGLVLAKSADIRMASEDLYMSPDAVRVHYTFTNDSKADIDAIVAFPLPDVDNFELTNQPMRERKSTGTNFMGFQLKVEGKPVTPQLEVHAMVGGKDVTRLVQDAGLPLSALGGVMYKALEKLDPKKRAALIKAGVLEDGGPDGTMAKWTTQTRFFWHQKFPAGKTIAIDHSYEPVTGGFHYSTLPDYDKQYCIDKDTTALIAKRQTVAAASTQGELEALDTKFIIVTANNWKAPIGRFHLTLDKLKPQNVLSLCWGPDLKKTGPTTFESTRLNFAPAHDIDMLVVY